MVKKKLNPLLVEYNKVGKDRYVRTITIGNKLVDIEGNLGFFNAKDRTELRKDFNKYKGRKFVKVYD